MKLGLPSLIEIQIPISWRHLRSSWVSLSIGSFGIGSGHRSGILHQQRWTLSSEVQRRFCILEYQTESSEAWADTPRDYGPRTQALHQAPIPSYIPGLVLWAPSNGFMKFQRQRFFHFLNQRPPRSYEAHHSDHLHILDPKHHIDYRDPASTADLCNRWSWNCPSIPWSFQFG